MFLTGTDEHGLKIQQAADAARSHPQGMGRPDGIAPKFGEAWKLLEIANADFIRTTESRATAPAWSPSSCRRGQHDDGYIELDSLRGKYCVRCPRSTTPRTSS